MWTAFECDGRAFEYRVMTAAHQTRSRGWPNHKPSANRPEPVVLVVVRNPGGAENGPAMVFPEGTVITTEHAIETARMFWAVLTVGT
jgi:hypothetical protein